MRIHVTVNGIRAEVDASKAPTLLDFIRDDLKLTGTKESHPARCACTVLVEGRASTPA